MALVMFDGFESAPTIRSAYTQGGGGTAYPGRDGIGKSISAVGSFRIPLPSLAMVIIGDGLYPSSATYGTFTASNHVLQIQGDAGITPHLTFHFDGTGHLQVRRGTQNGTVIGTGVNTITGNVWHYVEIKATIADAGGICVVKIDGVTEINYVGDTRNGGTAASISALEVEFAGLSGHRHDDLYVLDGTGTSYNDFIGERVIRGARPAGNGALSQLAGSDGDSTDNYQLVDELPLNTTDYVGSATPGQRDSYDCSAVSGLASIDAVQVTTYAAKSDSGTRNIRTLARSPSGTVVTSVDLPLSTTYALLQGPVRQTDADGLTWSQSSVNNHEYGVEVV